MKLIFDLDNTLCITENRDYKNSKPVTSVIETLREYHVEGAYIVIHTARNMNSFKGEIGKINTVTLPIIINWLKEHNVPFDEIIVGKVWCGEDGFYVDDRAIRPSEFTNYPPAKIKKILDREKLFAAL